ERGSNDREHHLEEHERLVRDGGRVAGRARPDSAQERPVEATDQASMVRAERERVAEQDPLDRDERQRREGLQQGGQHVPLPYHPAIEEREPWSGHEQE